MRVLRHICVCLFLAAFCLPLPAQSGLQGRKARKARLERDIRLLEKQIEATNARSNSAATQLDLLHAQTQARRELLQESERELGEVSDSARLVPLYTCQREPWPGDAALRLPAPAFLPHELAGP